MKTKSVIFSIFLLSATFSYAQEFLFKVVTSKGSNKVVAGGKETTLATGKKIYKGSKIKIAQAGYISLVHLSGKPLELSKSGTYDANELATKFNKKSGGFASKYSNFVFAEIQGGGKANVNTTGAVHRGNTTDMPIAVYSSLGKNSNIKGTFLVKNNPALVRWDVDKEVIKSNTFVMTLITFEEDVVYTKEVTGTSATIDLSNIVLEESNYFLKVAEKDNPDNESDMFLVNIMDEENVSEVDSDLKKLNAELTDGSAIDNLVYASYFEDKKLLLDAVESYEKAIEIAPDVDSYKLAYDNFLIRIGVKTED